MSIQRRDETAWQMKLLALRTHGLLLSSYNHSHGTICTKKSHRLLLTSSVIKCHKHYMLWKNVTGSCNLLPEYSGTALPLVLHALRVQDFL